MAGEKSQEALIIALHAFTGWLFCGATVGIGRELMSLRLTLIVHAIAAPLFFGIISFMYFRKFYYTSPFATALIFLAFVMALDFFVVALLIEKSLAMFRSPLGTWIPFALIFLSTFSVGHFITGRR